MDVLHITPAYEPAWAFGGTVTATSTLCRSLNKIGVDVTVYTTNVDGEGGVLDVPIGKSVDVGGVQVYYFGCDFGESVGFYSRDLAKKLKSNISEYDIVHSSTLWQWIQYSVYRASNRQDTPYVTSPHSSIMDYAFMDGSYWLKKIYWRTVISKTIKESSAIHYLCEGERQNSKAWDICDRSFVVPNGVDIERYQSEDQQNIDIDLGINEDSLVLLHLGRIHRKKNIDIVLDALGSLPCWHSRFEFIICGYTEDSGYAKHLQDIIQHRGLEESVHWVGVVDYNDIPSYYSLSDLLVLPSDHEGVSMTTLEAMATGLPVLVSDRVANHREIREGNAGIVTQPNPESVAKVLKNISDDPRQLTQMAQKSASFAEKRYDKHIVAESMKQAYQDILEGEKTDGLLWKCHYE